MHHQAADTQSVHGVQTLRPGAQAVHVELPRAHWARRIGQRASPAGHYARIAQRFTHYPTPLDFRSLCARVVSERTRYLVLDLDRTTHRGHNLGELLGWEIAAYECYGPEGWERLRTRPGQKRWAWDRSEAARFPAYMLNNIRTWAFPGLSYLLWGKLAAHVPALERWSYRKFGSDPVQAAQRIPQTALLHRMTTLPETVLRTLAQQVWDRLSDDQVIERADLAWVRERSPGIEIILTSASPQPMLEVAGQALGVDAIEFSGTQLHGDRFAAPYWVDPRFALGDVEHIAGPAQVRINSGSAKIERLSARFPDIFAEHVETVGISDTGYGEDHVWAQYFKVVVDVNSATAFSPIVAFDAPLREVHSAQLLTHAERNAAPHTSSESFRELDHQALSALLAPALARVEAQAAACQRAWTVIFGAHSALREQHSALLSDIDRAVSAYNIAPEHRRAAKLAALRRELGREAALRRQIARVERPLSCANMALARTLRVAREALAPAAHATDRSVRSALPSVLPRSA